MPSPLGPGGATRLQCKCDTRTVTDLARNIVKEFDLSVGVFKVFIYPPSLPPQNLCVMSLAFKTYS